MTAINSLFGKMQPFVTHENVVFMFDPKVYPPVVAGCTPTTINITGLPEDATGVTDADVLTATYSYAGGPEITVTFAGASQKLGLLRELATAINSDSGLYLIDNELGTAPYSIGYSNRHDIAGGDGSVSDAPADLVLSLTPGADYDAVAILFGSAITIHSCGPQTW